MIQLKSEVPSPSHYSLILAEVELARNNPKQARNLAREILGDPETSLSVLVNLTPLLLKLDDPVDILTCVERLVKESALDGKTAERIVNHLERKRALTDDDQQLAEVVIRDVQGGLRYGLMAVLARIYPRSETPERMVEFAQELSEVSALTPDERSAFHRALFGVATGLIGVGDRKHATELLEYQYFLQPDQGEPLGMLATLATELDQVRHASEYLEIFNLLRPWEARNGVRLARNWFFELGRFNDARRLVTSKKIFLKENPRPLPALKWGITSSTAISTRPFKWWTSTVSEKDSRRHRLFSLRPASIIWRAIRKSRRVCLRF